MLRGPPPPRPGLGLRLAGAQRQLGAELDPEAGDDLADPLGDAVSPVERIAATLTSRGSAAEGPIT